jgi:hypothetical protein
MWWILARHVGVGIALGSVFAIVWYASDNPQNDGSQTFIGFVIEFVGVIAALPWSLLPKQSAHMELFLVLNGAILGIFTGLIAVDRSRKEG